MTILAAMLVSGRAFAVSDTTEPGAPPIVEGYVAIVSSFGYEGHMLAVDAAGNRYVTGIFNTTNTGPVDFNPDVGVDAKTSAGNDDVFVTRINADGSYAWTQTFGGTLAELATGLIVSSDGSTVYATGRFSSPSVQIGGTGLALQSNSVAGSTSAYIIALDAATGSAKASFGTAGMQKFAGPSYSGFTGYGLVLSGSTLYVCGDFAVAGGGSQNGQIGGAGPTVSTGGAAAFILSLDATTGLGTAGFGSGGIQYFGGVPVNGANGNGAFGRGITINTTGTTIYVCGNWFGRSPAIGSGAGATFVNASQGNGYNGFVIAMNATTGAGIAGFGSNGMQTFGGSSILDSLYSLSATTSGLYVAGESPSTDAQIGQAGTKVGTAGGSDGVVLALDLLTGAGKAGFGSASNGIQFIGGTGSDSLQNIVATASAVYAAGSFGNDVKIGGAGTSVLVAGGSGGNENAMVVALDPATGAGKSGFGIISNGIQRLGGTQAGFSSGMALNGTTLFAAGNSSSPDFGVGAPGTFNFGGGRSYVAPIDGTTGAGLIHAPTDVTLSSSTVPEGSPIGTTVGTLSTANVDTGLTFTYSFINNNDDHSLFSITGSTLKTAAVLSSATKSKYSFTVHSSDQRGLFFDKALTVTLTTSAAPAVSIAATTPNASETANTPGVFTVTRSAASTSALTVNFTVSGSAVAGTDYTSIGTSVIIPANAATATISVAPIHDTNYKTSTTVIVTLASGTGYTVGAPSSDTVTISDVNLPPVFSSPATANPSSASVGTMITFTAAATDADNDPLTYTWNFADGTTMQGASVTHSFSTAGTYNVSVTVSDGTLTAVQNVSVSVTNPLPTPTGIALKFNFQKTGKDSLIIVGTLPLGAGYTPAGGTITVTIGGYTQDFTLSKTGAGKKGSASFTLKGRIKKGVFSDATLKYTLKVSNQDLYSVLKDNPGFSKTVSDPSVAFPILIETSTDEFLYNGTVNYTTNGKLGSAK